MATCIKMRSYLLVLCLVLILVGHCESWRRRRRRRCGPTNCAVSAFTGWSPCTASCGNYGTTTRTRRVIRGASCGGSCPYHLSETIPCNRKCCPVNCISSWGSWGACLGCGNKGTQIRTLVITRMQSCGGAACPSVRSQTRNCVSSRCCPVNCVVSAWGSWGSCNAQCEKNGIRSRTRTVTTAASCNGVACPTLTQYNVCNGPCCRRDCVLSTWSAWGTCNAPSGACSPNSGKHSRSRTLITAQSCGGGCFPLQESKTCTPVPITCQVTSWGTWSPCTPKTGNCGAGTQSRTRTISRQPYCSAACPSTTDRRDCTHSCCPVNCVLSQWTAWGQCSANCGTGLQQRTRRVVTPASCNGACSSNLAETKQCTVIHKVDCQTSAWSTWSTCSSGCGNGIQQRTRTITVQPTSCGQQCGNLTDYKQCQSYRENRDCQVSGWQQWGNCGKNCSYGTKTRFRTVTVSQRCRGSACPTLKETGSCGLPNGGCQQICRASDGVCSCMRGYYPANRTHCNLKDCGRPTVDYCPPGEAKGTVCLQPWLSCQNGKTTFGTSCSLSCPSTHSLKGPASISCESDGQWSQTLNRAYCRRINEPPTNIILSGTKKVAENSPSRTLVGSLSSTDLNTKDNHTYSLVTSSATAGKFVIIGNDLYTMVPFDYEAGLKSYSVGIKSTDNGNPPLATTKYFTISIEDVNEKPTNIVLSSHEVAENSDIGTEIGTFDTIDVDNGQKNTYRLLDSAGGLFRIVNNKLQVAASNRICLRYGSDKCPLNYEKRSSYLIEVISTDDQSPSFNITRQFNITVTNQNDPPYDLDITGNAVKENSPHGTIIGIFSARDEDVNPTQSCTFSLINDDAGRFGVTKNGSLFKAKDTDYEIDKTHSIQVKATDNGSPPAFNVKNFTIIVLDDNEPPVNITVSSAGSSESFPDGQPIISENSPIGTVIGTIEAFDSDFITGLNLTLDDDAGGRFKIASNQNCVPLNNNLKAKTVCKAALQVNGGLNYEDTQSVAVSIRAEDRGHFIHRTFIVKLKDENDPPRGLLIDGKTSENVKENDQGATIGRLAVLDEDANQTHTIRLLDDYQGTFVLNQNILSLTANVSLDYETKKSYVLKLDVRDNGTPAKSAMFDLTLNVTNENEAPTDIQISDNSVFENSAELSLVANISVTDPDDVTMPARKYHVCTLTDSASDRFKVINGLELVVGPSLIDYEAATTYGITMQCSDGALSVTKSFAINVKDVNEKPSSISITNNKITENQSGRILVGRLSTTDPDNQNTNHQSFKYSLTRNDSTFEIVGNALYCTAPFDYEKTVSVRLSVVSVDDGTPPLSTQQTLVLDIVDANDPPTDILISSNKVNENSPMDTVVGVLSTVDEDTSQSFVYHIANDAGGRFKIDGNVVKVACSNTQCLKQGGSHCLLNYEKNKNHVIQVKATDSGSPPESYTKNIRIQLNDVNDRPRDIKLSNYKIAENASINHIIGQFSATDEDEGQLLTFSLAKNDSGRFGVDAAGNLYKASETNYETNKTHEITVVVRDFGSPPLESSQTFVIEVLDVNEAPIKTVITSDGGQLNFTENNAKVNENSEIGTVIGSIVSYDSESNERIKFKLDDDAGGTFSLASNTVCKSTKMVGARTVCSVSLVLNGQVNYEMQALYWIIVRSTDNEGLFHTERLSVEIIDQNDAPTAVLIGGEKYAIVPENKQGVFIERLTTIDEDTRQSHVFAILGNNSQLYSTSSGYLYLSSDTVFDFEKQSKHLVTIQSTDSGQPRKSVVDTLELRVEDVNEAPTDVTLSSNVVNENSQQGTLVGTFSVTDPDSMGPRGAWQAHSCVVTSGGSGMFRVQGMQLIVAHNGIDYEKADSYNVSIRCRDSGAPTQFIEKSFVINVQDVNEKPTGISISSNVIPENSPTNTGIGLLTTTDPDNFQSSTMPRQKVQVFNYTILNNDPVLPFKIGSDNVLRTTRKLDFERHSSWEIRIRSYDSGSPAMFVDGVIIVNVTDVNEQPTDLSLSNTNIAENSGLGTLVGYLNTSDYDAGQSFTYSLVDNAGGLFRVIANRVEVAVNNVRCLSIGGNACQLNYEKNRILNIRVKSKDSGAPPLSYEKDITITLTDVNDKPRDILISANQLPENATKGYLIGQLSATDEDIGQNLTFTLIDDDNGRFTLNKDNFITKAKDTDYESTKSHKITVQVADNGNPMLKNTKDFVIIIKDVNEAPTKIEITQERGQLPFNKNSPRVNENSDQGTVVGTLFAFDEDLVESLKFTLDDDSSGRFAVDSTAVCSNTTNNAKGKPHTNCKVLLKVAGSIDYEQTPSTSIIVRVTDSNGLHHSQNFPVTIVDCNDKPTDITLNGGYVGMVNENENNAVIATLESEDQDKTQTHSYRILNDPDMNFIISGSKLYTSPHASLNYEKKKRYTCLIETVDNGSPPMHFQKNLTVQVMDVNEAPSAITLSNNNVKENSAIDTVIANVTVTDPDNEGAYAGKQRASCSVSSDPSGIFGIKDDVTLVVVKASLNYERISRYTIKLRCTDNGIPSKSLEQSFTIIVDDVNEAPTSIMLTDGTVPENQANALVGKLVVSDPDRTRQTFTLNIQDQNSPFVISGTDSLRTIGPLDFEKQYEHKVSIRAEDQGGLSVVENFTIHVQDRNDRPSSIMFTGSLSIQESTSSGVVVATASALDEDFHQTHSYVITSVVGNRQHGQKRFVQGYFAVDPSNGQIKSATSSIDYEEYSSFDITVVATDNGIPQMNVTAIVNIEVTDVNHPPTDIIFTTINVVENSSPGTIIGPFKVVDPDNKYTTRQNFTCRLNAAQGQTLPFTINTRNELVVNGVVDFEQQKIYSIEVTCTEIHANPYNITKNFILSVVNVNEAPTGISITSNTIPENRSPGYLIGTVVAVDPDNKLAHVNNVTIELIPDNTAFRLEAGNTLVANQTFDYEQKKVWTVKIRATDNGNPSLSSEQNLNIMILDMNDPPTDISLSAAVISENANQGTIIGQFATVDQDKGQSYTYTFINTIDNLAINGDKLVVSGKVDFESEPIIPVTVRVTDSGTPPLTFQKSFNITVTDANDAPSAIAMTIYPVPENNTLDKMVANIKVIDEDKTQTHSCSILGDPGNYYFTTDSVSHNKTIYIKGTVSLDFETSPTQSDTIRCYDNGVPAKYIDQQITIPILDSNDKPTRILINGADTVSLPENSPEDTVVGQLSCIDQDGGQSHTYELLNENNVFEINSELLKVKNSSKLNYEELPGNKKIPIKVTVTDNGNPSLSLTSTLQIQITDVNEAPSNVRMIDAIGQQIPENTTMGTHIGELFCDNPEGFRQLITYELLNWNDVFGITEGHGPGKVSYLTLKSELDFAKQSQYNLTVKAIDNGTPQLSAQVVITIDVGRSDPCYTGELHCGGEVCQRVNKTRGNCGCLAGYELKDNHCIEIDECKANCKYCENPKKACPAKKICLPCQNNATCHDKLLGFDCTCLPGFTDERCATNTDDCLAKPCQFGTCFDQVNDYRCECNEGYSGRNCSVDINECSTKECLKGDCKDLIAGFSCNCENGIFGLLCNRKVSDCEPNPCKANNLCVPPTYTDSKMVNGFKEPVCAGDNHIIELTFSNVPEDKDQLNKWKYTLKTFITTMIGIPYDAVDLSEDKSNGGIYYPTDVIMYPMRSASKTRRDTDASKSKVFPLVSKVNDKLVPENAFLIAMNKTCTKITQSSKYFVYCDAAYGRIKALGLTGGGKTKPTIDKSTGGPRFFTANNIYIIAGSVAGFVLLVAVVLMIRARNKRAALHRQSIGNDPLVGETNNYFDAMERHLAKRVEDSFMESVNNPLYGKDEIEVERQRRMFTNPLYGAGANTDDMLDGIDEDAADIDQDGGIYNPMYGQVAKLKDPSGDTDC